MNSSTTSEITEPTNAIPQKQKKTPIYVVKAQLNYIKKLKEKDPEGFKKMISERNARSRAKAKQKIIDKENENKNITEITMDKISSEMMEDGGIKHI